MKRVSGGRRHREEEGCERLQRIPSDLPLARAEYGEDRRPLWRCPLGEWTVVQGLHAFQLATATAHGAQALAILAFGRRKEVPLHIPYVTWPDRHANATLNHFTYHTKEDGSVDISSCLFGFFLLSWLFQTVAILPGFWAKYTSLLLDCYVQPFRWVEYSVSAALMALVFALLNGITETPFLYNIFVSFSVTMLLGLVQEIGMSVYKRREAEVEDVRETLSYSHALLYELRKMLIQQHGRAVLHSARDAEARAPSDVLADLEHACRTQAAVLAPAPPQGVLSTRTLVLFLPHLLGWLPFLAVVSVFLLSFSLGVSNSPHAPPEWVYFLYSFQFIIMSLFAVVQLVEQAAIYGSASVDACRRHAVRAEFAYTTLSLLAKSTLCWVLYINLLAEEGVGYQPA